MKKKSNPSPPLSRDERPKPPPAPPEKIKYTMQEILLLLVELKDHKDKFGKTEYYKTMQPKAWKLARAILCLN